jgi:uncharacterized protein YyaL (SSP411 family)
MNRLADSTSLYLQQHADNPVEWEPWDDAALQRAREEQRPILLSIGYSACHWCHVMAHESFEDPQTAQWMNALYVNIKVDREERPDLDRLYQLSHQLLTGRGGGWPLTLFLDPEDLTPFFAGTYFPPEPRHGLPGFADLLKKARTWFDTHREDAAAQAAQLTEAIARLQSGTPDQGPPGAEILDALPDQLEQNYDDQQGGFGGAPKFPQAPLLGLVQALASRDSAPRPRIVGMLHDTLSRMALSGLRDHLDGGFFRYCVDGAWTIPHFEKMLYDNAMLLPLYAETSAQRDDPFLARIAAGIVDWLESSMLQENGGFSASIDADADGEEGGFHVWQRDEVERLLSAEQAARINRMFGLDQPPNFEGKAWHLVRHDGDAAAEPCLEALALLRAAREKRVPPATDCKQLTSWNALCIDGLARAGQALGEEGWIDQASATLEFLRTHAWNDGGLHAVVAGGTARFPAYLDDYAGLLAACLSLLRARWRRADFDFALTLADALLERFMDHGNGGFFFTAEGAEAPIHRLRPWQDDALPSGNGVAARALTQLGHLAGDGRYLEAAGRTLAASRQEMERFPLAHAALMEALDEYLDPHALVIICGGNRGEREPLRAAAQHVTKSGHRLHCYVLDEDGGKPPGQIGQARLVHGAQAFVCHGTRCLPPTNDPSELIRCLELDG